jgi:hypothetical protein
MSPPECGATPRGTPGTAGSRNPRGPTLASFGLFRPSRAKKSYPARTAWTLEVEADLSGERPRSDVVRSAERGKEVVQGFPVGQIDDCEAETPFV